MLAACEEGYNNESTGFIESAAVDSVNSADSLSYLPPAITIPLRGPTRVRPLNPNLLRLAEWRMSILEDGAPAQTAAVPAIPLSDQLERGGFRFAPAVRRYFGYEPELECPPLHVRYETRFENSYTGPVEFVIEPGSIVGDWRLWVNDAGPLTAGDLTPTNAHVRGSLGADISAFLRPGSNTLRVEITDARPAGGLLNPLYLAGDFGVSLDPLALVERLAVGGFETYEANGLPFYAGVIEYALNFDLAAIPVGERVRAGFAADAPFHEACEVSINGGPWRALAWEPRSLELPISELRPGQNGVRVKVYTTLIRAFEGQWFDYDAHCYREIGEALAEAPQAMSMSLRGPSFGPKQSPVEEIASAQKALLTMTPQAPAGEQPEPQLQMVWPEHLLEAPPAVLLSPGYALRTYRPGDEPGFFRVMALAGWPGWDEAKLRPWLARIPPESWFMVIHEASGEIVATAMGLHDHSNDHPFGGELGWVAADPAHAGRGLGLAVSAAVTARLIEAGYRNVHLYTERWRLSALKTYLKLGYVPFLYQEEMAAAWQAICEQLGWPFDPASWRGK
jgi:mycothiol synthase